jgi:serine/threonine protein phosphatase 1
MRTLAIGDIHGCLRAFDLVLEMAQPEAGDVVVTLGDYIDRGPNSSGVLQRLIELQKRCRHVALKGNHDLMMLQARDEPGIFHDWLLSGGRQTLESYAAEPSWETFHEHIPAAHWQFLEERCVAYHEIETHFFVHANVYPDIPLAEQPDYMLLWEKLIPNDSRPHESGKIMICGHTPQRSGKPLVLEHAICIDTRVYGDDGWLTCLDVEMGLYWSANQKGETRTRFLEMD